MPKIGEIVVYIPPYQNAAFSDQQHIGVITDIYGQTFMVKSRKDKEKDGIFKTDIIAKALWKKVTTKELAILQNIPEMIEPPSYTNTWVKNIFIDPDFSFRVPLDLHIERPSMPSNNKFGVSVINADTPLAKVSKEGVTLIEIYLLERDLTCRRNQ